MVAIVQVPVALGGTNTAYRSDDGANGMKSKNGYAYASDDLMMQMLAEAMNACQAAVNAANGFPPAGGDVSCTGTITTTQGGVLKDGIKITPATSTDRAIMRLSNLSGEAIFGLCSSAAGETITGCSPYDALIRGGSGIAISANGGATLHGRMASTGQLTLGAIGVSNVLTLQSTANNTLLRFLDITAGKNVYLNATNGGLQLFNNGPVQILSVDETGLLTTTGQIKFPASQFASSDANTLDDYEEGTWTPALHFGGVLAGITYSGRNGLYTKVGRVVHLHGYFLLSSKGGNAGSARIESMPFASANLSANYTACALYLGGAAYVGTALAYVSINASTVVFAVSNGGATAALDDTNFTNATECMINCSYIAA